MEILGDLNYGFLFIFMHQLLFCVHDAGSHNNGYISVMGLQKNETVEIGPGNLKLSFSLASGQLTRIFNSRTGVNSLLLLKWNIKLNWMLCCCSYFTVDDATHHNIAYKSNPSLAGEVQCRVTCKSSLNGHIWWIPTFNEAVDHLDKGEYYHFICSSFN